MTGGILIMDSSSLGNLKACVLKGLAKIVQLGEIYMACTTTGSIHSREGRNGMTRARKRKLHGN